MAPRKAKNDTTAERDGELALNTLLLKAQLTIARYRDSPGLLT